MKKNIHFLGVDIGGAHIKIIGLDKSREICLVEYRKFYFWEEYKNFHNEIDYINSLSIKNIKCAITMTAELCDVFENRKEGFEFVDEIIKWFKTKITFWKKENYINGSDWLEKQS